MRVSDQYWLTAFFAGSVITVGLFLTLPNLRFDRTVRQEPVIVVDFMQWREPKPIVRATKSAKPAKKVSRPKPNNNPKPEHKPKPVSPAKLKKVKPSPTVTKKAPAPEPENQPVIDPYPRPEPVQKTLPPKPAKEPVTAPPGDVAKTDPAIESLPEPAPLFKLTSMPRFVHRVEPHYPADMRALGEQATLTLEVLIDRHGQVRHVKVLKSGGKAFDDAATKAMSASSFVPGNIEGTPVPVRMRIPIRFSLR